MSDEEERYKNTRSWRRGINKTVGDRLLTLVFPVAKIYYYFKYKNLYNAGYKLDLIIELITSSVAGLIFVTGKYQDRIFGPEHSLQERIDFDYGNFYLNWFAQYSFSHGHPIAFVFAFFFFLGIFKSYVDWWVGKLTKYRFISLVEMLWAKRRKKYLYKIRAVREELGKKKYLKLIRVTNAEYYSFW